LRLFRVWFDLAVIEKARKRRHQESFEDGQFFIAYRIISVQRAGDACVRGRMRARARCGNGRIGTQSPAIAGHMPAHLIVLGVDG
jgi:hypothetical protein